MYGAGLPIIRAEEPKKWSYVSDFARLDIVYQYGGIYLDTDVELIKPLDSLLTNTAYMGFEKTLEDNQYVASGLGFGSEEGNVLLLEMMGDYYKVSFYNKDGSLNLLPCPYYNTACLKKHGLITEDRDQMVEGMTIYASDVFCPKMYCDSKLYLTERTVSIHHYDATWLDNWGRWAYKRTIIVNSIFSARRGVKINKIAEELEYLIRAIWKRLTK